MQPALPLPRHFTALLRALDRLMQYPEQPRVRAPTDEALRIRRGDGDAGLLASPVRHGHHVLLERPAGPLRRVVLHLPHDLLPGTDVGRTVEHTDAVDVARPRSCFHPLQLREQRAEQLELPRIPHLAVLAHGFELREQEVFRTGVRGQLVQAVMPRDELGIVIGQAVNALLELDETPDREAVEVIGRRATLEVEQRRLVLAPIVQQVCEIDARLGVLQVELERPAQPVEGHAFVKRAARPHILLSREPGVSHAHMQLDGVGVEPQAYSQGLERFVVLGFVVELMRAFVVVVGAQERFRHRTGLPGRLCYDTTPRTVTQATDAEYLLRRCPPCPPRSRTFRTAPSPRRAASSPRPRTPASRPTARRTSRCSSARRAAPRRACSRRMRSAPRPWCTTPTSWPSGRDGCAQSR